jgi:catalase (peroxidase I)
MSDVSVVRDDSVPTVTTNLMDMKDVVHVDESILGSKIARCERLFEENWYSHASLRKTNKVVTCLLCLGLR